LLTTAELNARERIADPRWGAVAVFYGIVRGTEASREILGIEYEAHPAMAEHQMREIAGAAMDRFALGSVVLHHRVGFVPVSEPSLFVQVASGHRAAAFDALVWIVDELKKRVPIWKRPAYVEATTPEPAIAE